MPAHPTPTTFRRIMVTSISNDFRKSTEIRDVPIPELEAKTILVKMKYVGVNTSDINVTTDRFQIFGEPPYACGYEGMGEVYKLGPDSKFEVGQFVAFMFVGAYGEYMKVPEHRVFSIPSLDPNFTPIISSAPNAMMGLEKEGDLKEGQTVLVTAAAGATGMFAVQFAKFAGCHVIGTCGSPEKVEFLKSLGCDRPINYQAEDLHTVLQKEYPKGIDVVFESVGRKVFEVVLLNIARFARIIVNGQVSSYEEDVNVVKGPLKEPESSIPIAMSLVNKAAQLRGHNINFNWQDHVRYFYKLIQMYADSKLKVKIDVGERDPKGPFKGLERIPDALDSIYARKNIGKVVVEI